MTLSKLSPKIIGDNKLFHYSKYGVLVIGQHGMELFHIIELFQLAVPLCLYPCTAVTARAQRQLEMYDSSLWAQHLAVPEI